ncbi:MAG: cellulase family glycosylhydrolase [Chthoniobacteraceae bacterium]
MRKTSALLVGIVILIGNLLAIAQDAASIRVVDCGQKVQSRKRGLCANQLSAEDFKALAPGVSWFYNWHYEFKDKLPPGIPVEFIPMAWGDRPADLSGLQRYLSSVPVKPRYILGINEPNLKGQAFIAPKDTARLFRSIKGIGDRNGIPVIGPNMSLGSAENDSITAYDPIEKKKLTYTFMMPFLKAFYHEVGDAKVPATSFHSYGSIGELRWGVDLLHKEFGCPVWVTEYAEWKAPTPEAARLYLIQATDFLERTPYVQGYAWFKERVDGNPKISLFEKASGKLTPMGEAYVALPPHDADLYYRIPGRLQAENYVHLEKMEIEPTTDTNGVFRMTSTEPNGSLEYNIQVDSAGTYNIALRVGGQTAKFEIIKDGKVLASAESTQKDWQTVNASVALPAGAQTIRVQTAASFQSINWIEFSKQ